MALAAISDVEARLGRSLTTSEAQRAPGLLEEASELAIGYLKCDPTDTSVEPPTVPSAVVIVVSRMVARVLKQDETDTDPGSEANTTTAGPFSRTVRFPVGTTSGGPWLTKADKITMRSDRCEGGFTSLGTATDHTGRYRREVR